ncbi:MAG: metal ABC transporter permease [Roseiflexus sp.]|jgi:manganese/iron transport system permease protein|nr:metal ABC transporter permease [Roseiflexus sp.]MBO9333883.1 metal ABC transporter permease [Roseiflexus sp.]MBO9363713.1 metal ABC transporter permease [Roseiflexus sp.]MBO9380938.1 metal ABC transporter permease [Roseiflexus sp.]MBO9388020.1 metal ABC transporter permease [Roseiflexus sp.]
MNTLWSWIVAPLAYGFMQRGMLAAVLVGILCAIVGCYVVLRSMAFLGDALAHAVLPGVAIAYLMGANLLMGALVAAVVVALLISLFSRKGTIKEDTAIGIVFAAALALGVALISSVRTYAVDLTHIMFGNVLGVSPTDLWLIAGIGAAVLLTILAFYRQFLVIAFDPVLAATQRLPVERLRILLLLLIALTIVVSLQTVGVGLVAAMLVTPGTTAYLLTRRLPTMMMVAALIGAVASISGLYLSYYVNIASGAAVVLVATALFTIVFLFAPERGVVWRRE